MKLSVLFLLVGRVLPVVAFALSGSLLAEGLPEHLRDGFVVWETPRTGHWRIFKKSLDGGAPRRVSHEEERRNHFAAHISPDGTRVVYLSFPWGLHGYRKHGPDVEIPLWMIDLEPGSEPRRLVENARPYGEHRSAVWLNAKELVYLDATYTTRRLNVETGESSRMVKGRPPGNSWDHGYLVDPTLRHATSGLPGFFGYDAENRTVRPREMLGGCQPYFTPDGEWGYWMLGMGGPINRYNLTTGEIGTILDKDDPRMPANRNYVYFPHISPGREAIVFAASPDAHDHHESDYDLFVAPLNPATLELSGDPVRITTDPGTDRFPEVYLPPLALGRKTGKAPLQVHFEAEGVREWRVNGRLSDSGGDLEFEDPGTYLVEAEVDGETLRGMVDVLPPAPPRLLSAGIDREGRVSLTFNEPVNLDEAKFSIGEGRSPARVWREADGTQVLLEVSESINGSVAMRISGVRDTARVPNTMESRLLRLEAPAWPVNPEGLALVWETGNGQSRLISPEDVGGPLSVDPRGRARYTVHQVMRLDGGFFIAPDAADPLLKHFKGGEELTLEVMAHSRLPDQRGPARILSFSSGIASRNFTLGQEEGEYVVRLRTPSTGENAHKPQITLGPVDVSRPQHLLVTYRPGELVAYIDGEETVRTDAVKGGFENWAPQALLFGAEADGTRDWAGTMEGVAIYRRFMGAEEALANAREARRRLGARRPVPRSVVEARLLARTPTPSLEEIDPYRQIMVVYEYERVRTLAGPEPPRTFRVHHWGILDGDPQSLPVSTPGETARLVLEPFEAHTHLRDVFPVDTLDLNLDSPAYMDVAP